MITLILRAIIIYCIVLFSIRIMGKRQIGDMQPFELVVTLIIADLACIPMSDASIPIMFGIVPLFSIVVLHHFFTFLNRKSIFFRKTINGRPIIVVDKDGINYKNLKLLNMTINDLTEGLRSLQCFDLSDVAFAIVETNGKISVLLKSSVQPASKEDMKLSPQKAVLSAILVNDGKIIKENLKTFNLEESFIKSFANKQKTKNISDILIFTLNELGEVFYQEKNKPCQDLTIKLKEKHLWKDLSQWLL